MRYSLVEREWHILARATPVSGGRPGNTIIKSMASEFDFLNQYVSLSYLITTDTLQLFIYLFIYLYDILALIDALNFSEKTARACLDIHVHYISGKSKNGGTRETRTGAP